MGGNRPYVLFGTDWLLKRLAELAERGDGPCVQFLRIGFLRLISASANSPPLSYSSLNR